MHDDMREMKATAMAHLQRDMDKAGKWVCGCEDCHEIRALMGMDKLLVVWPRVRELLEAEADFSELPEGAEKDRRREDYLKLHDRLADVLAK